MKIYRILLLLIILLVCGGYIYQTEFKNQKQIKIAGTELPEINPLQINSEKVFFLGFKNKNESFAIELNFEKGADQQIPDSFDKVGIFNTIQPKWVLMSPAGAVVNVQQVNKIINLLGELRIRGVIHQNEQAADLADYGLAQPHLVFNISDGKERSLEFGDLNFLSGHRYLRIKGDSNVYLVDNFVFNDLDLVAGQVRSSKPYEIDLEQLSEVLIQPFGKPALQFVKAEDDEWFVFAEGGKFLADKELVEKNFNTILNWTVERFLDKGMTELRFLGLAPAELVVELTIKGAIKGAIQGEGGKEVTTGQGRAKNIKLPKILFGQTVVANYGDEMEIWQPEFGKKEEDLQKVYFSKLETSPFVYKLSGAIYQSFLGAADYFKDRKPFRKLDVSKIDSVKLVSLGQEKILTKQNGSFDSDLSKILNLQVIAYNSLGTSPAQNKDSASLEIKIIENSGQISSLVIRGEVLKNKDVKTKTSKAQADKPPCFATIRVQDGKETMAIISSVVVQELKEMLM
ncbi:MAG: DUF4340 domain-containing protein [Deltaproteobacteria bacterium]|jgi:hypothetical protein|nr:DUF4340 domain-containing protein [Deltaproteobacteria bacterium]